MKRKSFLIALAISTLAGCASGPKFTDMGPPPDGRSYIVVYRAPALASSAYATTFWLNGRQFAGLYNSGYTFVSVKPGSYRLHFNNDQSTPENTLQVDVKPGQRLFLRFVNTVTSIAPAGPGFLATSGATFQSVEEARALAELADYKFTAPSLANID